MTNTENVEIKHSTKHGQGLFAKKDFAKGEKVYSFPQGKIIFKEQIKDLEPEELNWLDKISDVEYEVMAEPARFVNHSCEPDIEENNRVGFASRNIKAGEELTVDYDKSAFLPEPFLCNCAARTCRGIIMGKV